jgi:UDP-2,4-diacetamido-2,4,6-trideoxy-beta-L-altropyranose hydrolase
MRIFFVTEASHEVGLGHFMRCFALAQEASGRGLSVSFVMEQSSPFVQERLGSMNAKFIATQSKIPEICMAQILTSEDWCVVDSYRIDADFLAKLKGLSKVLVFDDLCALPEYSCDLIVNASQVASKLSYEPKLNGGRLLAGPTWSPIRKEFQVSKQYRDQNVPSITVMLGGSDPRGLTKQIALHILKNFQDYATVVVVGPAFKDLESLQKLEEEFAKLTVHCNPQALVELLSSSDLVITAAGGSVGELCTLGQMAVCLVVVDNQKAALACCPYPVIDARNHLSLLLLEERIKEALMETYMTLNIRERARSLIDGKGCSRILDAMLEC